MRVLLDTNVLISALIQPRGSPAAIYALWAEQKFDLLCSPALLTELERVLALSRVRRFIVDPEHRITEMLADLRALSYWIEPVGEESIEELRDRSDTHVLNAAVAGRADVIVTGDQDLLVLEVFQGIRIVPPSRFVADQPPGRVDRPNA